MRLHSRHALPVVLALLMLFAQQGTWRHALSHGVGHASKARQTLVQNDEVGGHAAEVCDECLAFAALGATPPAAEPLAGPVFDLVAPPDAPPLHNPLSGPAGAYRARAPPRFV